MRDEPKPDEPLEEETLTLAETELVMDALEIALAVYKATGSKSKKLNEMRKLLRKL